MGAARDAIYAQYRWRARVHQGDPGRGGKRLSIQISDGTRRLVGALRGQSNWYVEAPVNPDISMTSLEIPIHRNVGVLTIIFPLATDDSGNKNNLLFVPESNHPEIEQSKASSPATLPHTKAAPTSTTMDRETGGIEGPKIAPETNDQKPILQGQEESQKMSLPAKSSTQEDSNGSPGAPDSQAANGGPGHLQLPDASNDNTKTPPGSKTPDIAQVAAEVADSAAKLDNGPPSPDIPDDEAGRIGYRRMSNTPIPEISETAVEVADVAAKLDRAKPV